MSAVEGWAITVAMLAVIAMVPTRTLLMVILAVVALPVALALFFLL